VNFDGTGTVSVRASYNVSSITDNGVGDYTVNFATALADANYATAGTSGRGNTTATAGRSYMQNTAAPTASAFQCNIRNTSGSKLDDEYVFAAFFR
jgi:hypothetical protein